MIAPMWRYLHIFLTLFLLLPTGARAGVTISLSRDVAPLAEVVVETKVRYSGLHGSFSYPLGLDILKAGETKSQMKLGVIPFLYEGIYANAFHPAYYIDSRMTKEAPFLMRTVELPTFQPRSWVQLLETGEPLRKGGVGITAGSVNDHFYMILRYFLPGFDQAGGTEDLRRYIPLLEKLASFAHSPQALANSQQNMRRFSRKDPDKYVESVKKTEGGYRRQLTYRLLEIKGWLALSQSERLPMYEWLKNLRKPSYVYRQIMDDYDRQQLDDFLHATAVRGHKRSISWSNPNTRVKFSLSLQGTARNKNEYGYSTILSTNLNPRLGLTHKTRYGGQCYPRFFQNKQGTWELQTN